ncbi:MAG: peptidylprolyl isomerase [Deltaproteobacteria bacterium]|nr:peptidylprolyl isomerase [Deltaproteobacteria bacterium]
MACYRLSAIAIASAVLLALLGCPPSKGTQDGAASGKPAASGAPIAEVNGVAIARTDFERQLDRTRDRFRQANRDIPPALETRLKENILRRLVEDELIVQKAKAEQVTLADEEFEARFADHRKRFGSDQAYQDFLKRTNQSEQELRSELKKTLLRERLYAKLIPDSDPAETDAKAYYEKNLQRYVDPEQIKASHILLKYQESDPDPVKQEKIAKCKKLTAEAKKGGDFAKLASEHSDGPTASRGGDLGFFPRGRMVKQFEDAAFAAKPGSVVGPIETPFGCHVVKVFEKKERRQRPFEEAKPSVLATLKAIQKGEATRNLLAEMRRNAQVKVLEPGLSYQIPTEPAPSSTPALPQGAAIPVTPPPSAPALAAQPSPPAPPRAIPLAPPPGAPVAPPPAASQPVP